MIRRVKYKDIDRKKYQNCIQKATNYRIYAEDWYLDIVTEKQWDCLVYGDYSAVMPLPYIYKLGFKVVEQPIFCQQLGIFSEILDANINQHFLKQLFKLKFQHIVLMKKIALNLITNY